MGYGIVGRYRKSDEYLINIQCQYAYQQYFREAFECEITDWNGRLCKKDIHGFIQGLNKFINMLENGIRIPMYRGYLGNISPDRFINELKELKSLIKSREVRYLSIG